MKIHLLLIPILILLLAPPAPAVPEYAADTAQPCSTCHTDTTTGELTDTGKAYSVTHRWPPGDVDTGKKVSTTIAGFVHLLSSMILVGSMVFVHTIIKADTIGRTGVPGSELKIGWISLFFIGISGIYLTIIRFHTLDDLLYSYPGRLVVGKIVLYSIMVAFAAVVTLAINKRLKSDLYQYPVSEEIDTVMTPEELSEYDGSSGKSYVDYGGLIYDVTESRLWKNGIHVRRHRAGTDLTQALTEAPHGSDRLDAFPLVGQIKQSGLKGPGAAFRIFKVMAVTNFFISLLAVLLSALLSWPL